MGFNSGFKGLSSSSPAVGSLTRQPLSVYSLWTEMCPIEGYQHRFNITDLWIAYRIGPTPHFAHTSQHPMTHMRIQGYACGVLSNHRQNTAQFANRRQTYSIFTPAFTLCLFLPISLFHSLPSFPFWYLFLWSVLW